jgi:uncharacterized Zn finger protein (UPF0148 family)
MDINTPLKIKTCPDCHEPIGAGEIFCTYCGRKNNSEVEEDVKKDEGNVELGQRKLAIEDGP